MALSSCKSTVDDSHKELLKHGTPLFPIACYHDNLGIDQVPWHWHEEFEAVVVSAGQCMVAAGTEKYLIRAGEGFFVNAKILHSCWDWQHSACRLHSVVFHPRLVGGGLDSVFHQNYVRPLMENTESIHLKPDTSWHRKALEAIEHTWQAGACEPYGYEMKMRNFLSEFVLTLLEQIPHTQSKSTPKDLRDGERIKQMLQYIQNHCAEELKVQGIAQSAAVSASECLRCFRRTIGMTPIQYVRQYRIQKAAQLLSTTNLPISHIAEACGFQDFSYFTKTFREEKGCPPSAYRKHKQASFDCQELDT